MAKLIRPGDAIIGEHIDGHTRKPVWKGLKKHPVLKQNMTLYECSRNSYAEIVKECDNKNIIDNLKEHNTTTGDCLEADGITIYVDSPRKITFSNESGTTGRHGSHVIKLRKLAICRVKVPLKSLEKKISQLNQSKSLDS